MIDSNIFEDGAKAIKDKRFKDAIKVFQEITQKEPQNHVAWNALGIAFAEIGDFDSAAESFKQAYIIDPANPRYINNLRKNEERKSKLQPTIEKKRAKSQSENLVKNSDFKKSIAPNVLNENNDKNIKNITSCPHCGIKIEQIGKFCCKCGKNIYSRDESQDKKFCKNCGNPFKISLTFCPHCGTQVNVMGKVAHCSFCGANIEKNGFCGECGNYVSVTEESNNSPEFLKRTQITEFQVDPYKSNGLLFIWPFIGAFLFFGGIKGGLLFALLSGIFIFADANNLKVGIGSSSFDSLTWKPWEWGLITFLLLIIGYPLYLYKRRELYETKNNLRRTSTSGAKSVAGVIGGCFIFMIIVAGLMFSSYSNSISSTPYPSSSTTNSITSLPTPFQNTVITPTVVNPNGELTQDSIRGLLVSMDTSNSMSPVNFKHPDDVSISNIQITNDQNSGLKSVKIVYFLPYVWDVNNFMAQSISLDSAIFENLLKDPKIGKITAVSTLKLTDKYGKENIQEGLSVTMSKSTANRINWENLLAIGDYSRLLNVADGYIMNPSVRAGL